MTYSEAPSSEALSSEESSFVAQASSESQAWSEARPSFEASSEGAGPPAAREIPTRKNFPETWLFENIDKYEVISGKGINTGKNNC